VFLAEEFAADPILNTDSKVSCEDRSGRRDADPALPSEPKAIAPLTLDSDLDDDDYCFRKMLSNPICLVCLQTQKKVAKWGMNRKLLRRALCGRWDLLQSLRNLGEQER
jgi:hypothetical protein